MIAACLVITDMFLDIRQITVAKYIFVILSALPVIFADGNMKEVASQTISSTMSAKRQVQSATNATMGAPQQVPQKSILDTIISVIFFFTSNASVVFSTFFASLPIILSFFQPHGDEIILLIIINAYKMYVYEDNNTSILLAVSVISAAGLFLGNFFNPVFYMLVFVTPIHTFNLVELEEALRGIAQWHPYLHKKICLEWRFVYVPPPITVDVPSSLSRAGYKQLIQQCISAVSNKIRVPPEVTKITVSLQKIEENEFSDEYRLYAEPNISETDELLEYIFRRLESIYDILRNKPANKNTPLEYIRTPYIPNSGGRGSQASILIYTSFPPVPEIVVKTKGKTIKLYELLTRRFTYKAAQTKKGGTPVHLVPLGFSARHELPPFLYENNQFVYRPSQMLMAFPISPSVATHPLVMAGTGGGKTNFYMAWINSFTPYLVLRDGNTINREAPHVMIAGVDGKAGEFAGAFDLKRGDQRLWYPIYQHTAGKDAVEMIYVIGAYWMVMNWRLSLPRAFLNAIATNSLPINLDECLPFERYKDAISHTAEGRAATSWQDWANKILESYTQASAYTLMWAMFGDGVPFWLVIIDEYLAIISQLDKIKINMEITYKGEKIPFKSDANSLLFQFIEHFLVQGRSCGAMLSLSSQSAYAKVMAGKTGSIKSNMIPIIGYGIKTSVAHNYMPGINRYLSSMGLKQIPKYTFATTSGSVVSESVFNGQKGTELPVHNQELFYVPFSPAIIPQPGNPVVNNPILNIMSATKKDLREWGVNESALANMEDNVALIQYVDDTIYEAMRPFPLMAHKMLGFAPLGTVQIRQYSEEELQRYYEEQKRVIAESGEDYPVVELAKIKPPEMFVLQDENKSEEIRSIQKSIIIQTVRAQQTKFSLD